MARTKSQPAELIPDVALNPELEATQNLMATVSSQMNDERDLLNQLLGQAQMAGAFEDFSRTVRTSKLAFVKENKLYRNLKDAKNPHGAEKLSGTWEEFCGLLGRSVDQVDRDIANLTAFGEEALESMSRMGIGYRELRQFRRLPEDQKSALIEVAKEGDKTALLELAEEMIAKHAREKEELKTDLEISRQMLAEKKEELGTMRNEKEELKSRLVRRTTTETPDEEGVALETEVTGFKNGVLSAFFDLKSGFNALTEHTERTGINHTGMMAGLLDDLQAQFEELRQEFSLPEARETSVIPDWVKEAQQEDENNG
ncbi:hypothetical protein PY834_001353 [Salmonella enterica]|uniref:DUF3102 domain-containing protein n=1 Tax=Salmonella enterica TaxID=28901 RepID=A0A5V0SVZ1_SALER|nr:MULTISPECIES: hypothetical protein [Klebsiella]EAB4718430.1 hypothetical protein [Salmonella enterica]EBS4769318.1 hypothetical protein [Salmonella enterica subsp. enterica serovar Sandiego]ECB0373077.1 hypothetical protein [Salmonella enterica subsp. enterica serovar Muenchen]ECU9089567.1 hypothetical protein [Salmonella enterica subsp. enterica serovar Cotham]EDV8333560.1 hypothetical protein [Salmonella enterica subsp. enterica serovar Baildon]EDX6970341.1 hypothetical protein [Salmonel